MGRSRHWVMSLFAMGYAMGSTAAQANEPLATSRHSFVDAGGQTIKYVAEAGRLEVRDDGGVVRGRFFFIAYRAAGRDRHRPLTFVWNGGPGSNATTLHFFGVGPKRIAAGKLIDNPDSLLASSDLVFFDPMSTGYSRAPSEKDAKAFYGTDADIEWTARFIATWRARFRASNRSLFLLGESFGVPRAAGAAEVLARQRIPVKGVILISGGKISVETALPASLAQALTVPSRAIAAFTHGKSPATLGRSEQAVGEEADRWARTDYAPALARIDRLSDQERQTIANGLAARIGVAPATIDRSTLVVTSRAYLDTLVPGEHLHPFDMRKPMTPDPEKPANDAIILNYLANGLGYRTSERYWNIEPGQPDVNAAWHYTGTPADIAAAMAGGGPPESTAWLSHAITLNPDLRAFVAVGRFDSQNSCEANAALHAIMPPAEARAIETHCYRGGHTIFKEDAVRGALSADIEEFIKRHTR